MARSRSAAPWPNAWPSDYRVTVFTTCATDYVTWRNALPEGREELGGSRSCGFPVEEERDLDAFNRFAEPLYRRATTVRRSSASCAGRVPTCRGSSRRCGAARTSSTPSSSSPTSTTRRCEGLEVAPERADPGAHHPRRAAPALLDLSRDVRAAAGLRLPHPRPRRPSCGRASTCGPRPAAGRRASAIETPERPDVEGFRIRQRPAPALRPLRRAASTRARAATSCWPSTTATGRPAREGPTSC